MVQRLGPPRPVDRKMALTTSSGTGKQPGRTSREPSRGLSERRLPLDPIRLHQRENDAEDRFRAARENGDPCVLQRGGLFLGVLDRPVKAVERVLVPGKSVRRRRWTNTLRCAAQASTQTRRPMRPTTAGLAQGTTRGSRQQGLGCHEASEGPPFSTLLVSAFGRERVPSRR